MGLSVFCSCSLIWFRTYSVLLTACYHQRKRAPSVALCRADGAHQRPPTRSSQGCGAAQGGPGNHAGKWRWCQVCQIFRTSVNTSRQIWAGAGAAALHFLRDGTRTVEVTQEILSLCCRSSGRSTNGMFRALSSCFSTSPEVLLLRRCFASFGGERNLIQIPPALRVDRKAVGCNRHHYGAKLLQAQTLLLRDSNAIPPTKVWWRRRVVRSAIAVAVAGVRSHSSTNYENPHIFGGEIR